VAINQPIGIAEVYQALKMKHGMKLMRRHDSQWIV
jgi:hypothetical protein